MYYCNKCQKEVNKKKDLYKGLCENCYRNYLLEKIQNIDSQNNIKNKKNTFSIKQFLKKIFKK